MTKRKQGFAPLPRRAILAAAAGAAVSAGTPGARAGTAEDWPTRPVRYINLFPPGGATDVMSRIYCARMGALAGQQFVVENRAGAGGTVGQAAIAQAAPDGYTIGLGSIASLAIAPSIYPSLPYDPGRDFTFVAGVWKVPNLLVVNLDFPPRSLPELIRLVRENPGRFSYGSGGSGTSPHLTMELLKHHAGLEMLHVPYRGGAPAMIDLLAGRIQLMFDNIPTVVGALREGRMRALGVTGAERNPAIPEVPAIREFLPDFEEITSWGGVVGPPGLAPGVVRRLNALTKQALADEELQAIFRQNGATAWWTTPAEFAAFREQQQAFFAQLVRISGAALN